MFPVSHFFVFNKLRQVIVFFAVYGILIYNFVAFTGMIIRSLRKKLLEKLARQRNVILVTCPAKKIARNVIDLRNKQTFDVPRILQQ